MIGRSNIVGKPMALLLLQADATVTVCHSRTADLAAHTRQRRHRRRRGRPRRNADRADMVKPGAVVIDVGMNRDDDGKLCGDVDFAGVAQIAGCDHAGAGRRRPDDDRHAAVEHGRCRRARGGRDFLTVSGRGKL